MNPRAAALALGLHACLLVPLLPACTTKTPPAPKTGSPRPAEKPVFVRLVPDGTQTCARSYIGIGLMSSFTGYVSDIAPGSPAERAHIRVGDVFENRDDFEPDGLPEGSVVVLQMRRGDVVTLKTLRVARVCYR